MRQQRLAPALFAGLLTFLMAASASVMRSDRNSRVGKRNRDLSALAPLPWRSCGTRPRPADQARGEASKRFAGG